MQNGKTSLRTHRCGEIGLAQKGTAVTLCGWVQRRRNLGGLIFVTLRDRSGIVQCVFDESKDAQLAQQAFGLRSEYVVSVTGTVCEREENMKNAKMATGDIEVLATGLTVFTKADTPPFEIVENSDVNEMLRLKYRYLDLRRPEMQRSLALRHRIMQATRQFYTNEGFYEIETPILTKSTPEGARDYLVPSRIHAGKFYALPQSPQQYKQLLMISGFDRYFQIARCMRDEDLRIDRQPEFTQIDLEMSFVDQEDVLEINERFIQFLYKEVCNREIELPLRRLRYEDAMATYGSDKPDLRFGYEIHNLSDLCKDCGFGVFTSAVEAGGSVRAIKVDHGANRMGRKEIDALGQFVKTYRAGGLAWIRLSEGTRKASFEKFVTPELLDGIVAEMGGQDGDLIFIVADKQNKVVFASLGALRCECARRMDVIDPTDVQLLWVVDFPMFEYSEEEERYVACHHPFTAPKDEDMDRLESDKANVKAKAYDMVLNGFELGGGSIRIHDSDLQARMFHALGLSEETLQSRFGHLIEAFRYGAPPHGGLAFGLDRICMLLGGQENIRDVIAFPKIQNATEPMMASPDTVSEKQLQELHIAILPEKE